jgi:flagellar biosynthesis anti-sigma factor FlgM
MESDMKIGDVKDTTSQMIQQYQRNVGVGQSVDRPSTTTPVLEEKVDLSKQSRDLVRIKEAIAQIPELREEKVQELRTQIEKGAYNIQSSKIAEKMIGESLIDIFA